MRSRATLRAELQVTEVAGGARLIDPRTRRSFDLAPAQARVALALDGRRTPTEIARDVLGSTAHAAMVGAFIEKLDSMGFLDSEAEADDLQTAALVRQSEENQSRRLVDMVRWACAHIPFHRERLSGLADGFGGLPDLGRLPLMTKRDMRENFPRRLIPDGNDMAGLLERGAAKLTTSSGSTGERLEVLLDAQNQNLPHNFPGIDPVPGGWAGARIAWFTTPICSGAVCHMGGMPYEARVFDETSVMLNSSDRVMRLTRAELIDILGDIDRHRPNVLYVDPIYGASLVLALQREGLPLPKVDVVWTMYEFCSVLQRRLLEEAFQVQVHTMYAASDTGGIITAFMCSHGHYHLRDRHFVLEILRGGDRVPPGELGELVLTTLENRIMPVIRYRIGDVGRWVSCSCPYRHLPAFTLEGRIKDLILDTRGALVTSLAFDRLFDGLSWLAFYSVAQQTADEYDIHAVKRPGGDEAEAEVFQARARALLGDAARIRLRYVRELPVEPSFKYRISSSAVWSSDRW